MESIFEDGYLKPEFINPNYRGLAGWPCVVYGEIVDNLLLSNSSACRKTCLYLEFHLQMGIEEIKIPQFTPEDIPDGELCWYKVVVLNKYGGRFYEWIQAPYYKICDETLGARMAYRIDTSDYCVPKLIAERAEDAERLKDWAKNE